MAYQINYFITQSLCPIKGKGSILFHIFIKLTIDPCHYADHEICQSPNPIQRPSLAPPLPPTRHDSVALLTEPQYQHQPQQQQQQQHHLQPHQQYPKPQQPHPHPYNTLMPTGRLHDPTPIHRQNNANGRSTNSHGTDPHPPHGRTMSGATSGSSTDPGIREFTESPPKATETRRATCTLYATSE